MCIRDRPNRDRVPVLVFTDEAGYWLPQSLSMSYLDARVQAALTRANLEMVTMGRKRGVIPAYFTQRIADFDKRIAAQADLYILMRQRQDVDINRYKEYIGDEAKQAASFGVGEGMVILPSGERFLTTFYERASQHVSNTPKAETAMRRFGNRPVQGSIHRNPLGRHGERRNYPVPRPVPEPVPILYRPSQYDDMPDFSEPVPEPMNAPIRPSEQAVQGDQKRFTLEQETTFRFLHKKHGSIKQVLTMMGVSYGRYQRHASEIVRTVREEELV